MGEIEDRVIAQARDVLNGEANATWSGGWVYEWAEVIIRLSHPCPKGNECALNNGAVSCNHCGRNWPPDETWEKVA